MIIHNDKDTVVIINKDCDSNCLCPKCAVYLSPPLEEYEFGTDMIVDDACASAMDDSDMNTDELLADREKRYGPYKTHSTISQNMKLTMQVVDPEKWDMMPDSHKESLEMIVHKIARIINGDPNYRDNWVDIAGYATLITQEIDKNENN